MVADDQEPRHIFVYGSLRPDALATAAQMGWTASFIKGMKKTRARVYNAALYQDQFACAVLGGGGVKAPALLAKPSLRRSWTDSEGIRGAAAEVIAASDFVEGWVLTPTMGTSAQPDAREEKRAKFKAAAMFKLKQVLATATALRAV